MIDWERHGLDRRYFVPSGAEGMAERQPLACPEGHPWGPDRLLVSAFPCSCTRRPHRIWRCWSCGRVWVRPPCPLHPEWTLWDPTER